MNLVLFMFIDKREDINIIAEDNGSNFKSYLDILLELNAKDPTFTTQQVKNEIDTIIFGGQETVATTIFYVLLMIGYFPRVLDKLYAEIKEIFENGDWELTNEDLARMTYCEAVIDEESCTVPDGVICVVNIFGVGRSERFWGPDANEFRPERFESGPAPDSIQFGIGKRACIGKQYALPFLKTILAYCVNDLVFTAEPDKVVSKLDIVLRTVPEKVNLRHK